MKKRIIVSLLMLVMLFQFSASAASPYQSYVYDFNGVYLPAPEAMTYEYKIDIGELAVDDAGNTLGSLQSPQDIYVYRPENSDSDENALIYISDTGNQRIVILNSDYSYHGQISTFKNTITDENGKTTEIDDHFYSPTSVFITTESYTVTDPQTGVQSEAKREVIYVCDQNGAKPENTDAEIVQNKSKIYSTINTDTSGRILKFDYKTGELIDNIVGIDSSILDDKFIFQPKKVVVDSAGRMFVLCNNFNLGVMELDEKGEFVQCLGAPPVTYNLITLIWRFFSTEEQTDRMESFVPTEYSGIDIDEDGFIYVTNSTFDQEDAATVKSLSRLNAKGADVLKSPEYAPYGDVGVNWLGTYEGPSRLVDVLTLDNEMYAVLDNLRSRVFFYNSDGVNLFEFGTVVDQPDERHTSYVNGTLPSLSAVAIEWINDSCILLSYDASMESASLNVYSMTDYASKILYATELHYNDQYDEEVEVWQEVLSLNANSVAAQQSIGEVYYRNGDYQTAMKYFKAIYDNDNYSRAYKHQRQIYIENYFGIAVAVIVLLIAVIIILKKLYRRYVPPVKEHSYLGHLKYAKTIMARPLHGYWFLVRENHATVLSATTILAVTCIVSVLQARFTGFIFDMTAERVNIFLEIAKIVAPLLLFVVCNWCVTSLMAGEGSFKAIYIASCYALTPIIVLYPISIILSNIMVKEEGNLYVVFLTIAMIYMLFLIVAGNMRAHDYSLGMTILELFITVLVMLLVVFLAILFFALVQQMYQFVADILLELSLRS